MRPTTKEYNQAVLSAHNWRLNADAATVAADYWQSLARRYFRLFPLMLIVGVMAGVLGTLLAASAFNLN